MKNIILLFAVMFILGLYDISYAKRDNFQFANMGKFNKFTAYDKKNNRLKSGFVNNGGSIIINENINDNRHDTNVYQTFEGGSHNNVYGPSLQFGRVIRK